MNATIKTYQDLEAEKLRLDAVLSYHANEIRKDVADIREELRPVRAVMNFLAKFANRSAVNPLWGIGLAIAGDIALKNALFTRGGLITKITPYLLRTFSSPSILQTIAIKFNQLRDRFRNGSH